MFLDRNKRAGWDVRKEQGSRMSKVTQDEPEHKSDS